MKLKLWIVLSFLAIGLRSYAQEGIPVYFDYLADNYYLVFPSMAGISQGTKIRGTIRKQWFDVDGAPNLQTLDFNSRIGEKTGIGAIIYNDANGYHSQTGVKLTYAYHLQFSSDPRILNQLSFGINVGVLQSNLDESEFQSAIPDPIITGGKNSVSYFNMDLGMSYNLREFYANVAILNLLGSGRDLYSAIEFDNLRRYLFNVGYVFGKDVWQLEPSVLLQITDYTKESTMDFNAKVYRDVDFGKVWAGLSYRLGFDGVQYLADGSYEYQRLQLITPIVGVNFKKFMVSYNYSYQMGDVRFDNGGFHQITLGYDFGQPSEKRYDCNCPAVN